MKIKLILFLAIDLTLFSAISNSQTISIQGNVKASRYPVKNALVTFIDNADTNDKYTATTDEFGNYQIGLPTSVDANANNLPSKFELAQNYPNPFTTVTAIPYQIKKESNVHITIYDILGRVVKQFYVGQQSIGAHDVLWDGRNGFGQKVASGVYFYRLSANGETQVKKMVLNESSSASISLPAPYSSPIPKTNLNKQQNIKEGYYTISVGNTNNTTPVVVSEQVDNVHLQNDTTFNFSVINYIPVASINLDSTHQIIRGFGAANIVNWRPDMTNSEIQTAFGTGDGQLGFTILRLRIPPDSTQWSINISTAKKAYDMGVKIMATPWTPPASMKTNNSTIGGELNESSYADYAAYLNAFVNYMSRNGIPLYAVSLQNEPDITVGYESCDWKATQFLNFCKNDAQLIGTKVIMPESYHFDHSLSDPALNDSVAASHISIIGGHIYGGGTTKYPLAEEKGKETWMTEYLINSGGSSGTNPTSVDTGWVGAMQTANSISGCMAANMSAYVYWYIVRFYGPIDDDTFNSANKGKVTKKGYVMSQFARFIRPGYYRVECNIYPPTGNIDVSTYKDSSSSKQIIIAINNSTTQAEQVFRIQNELAATFTPYTTSATKNCEQGNDVTATNGSFTVTLDASSITTFISN